MMFIGELLLVIGILLLIFDIGMIAGVTCGDPVPKIIIIIITALSVITIIIGAVLTGTDILTWLGLI